MGKFNIQKITKSLLLAFATDANSIESAAFAMNGIVRGIIFTIPALTGSDTATLNIKDAAGNVVFTKGTLAESTTQQIYLYDANNVLSFPVSGNYTLEVITSGDQDANRTFGIDILVERG